MPDISYDPASHYDRVTEAWRWLLGEELHYGVFDRGDEDLPTATGRLTALMAEVLGVDRGLEVLDVGCGSGAPACWLASRGAVVTGITTSAAGVTAADARAAAAGLSSLARFMVRDGTDNGFADSSFDRIWVLESSHLMRDRAGLVSECTRVVRSGGRLGLCDIMLQRALPFTEVRALRHSFDLLRQVFGAARMDEPASYIDLFEEGGLRVDTRQDLTEATRPTFARWRDNAELHRDNVVPLLGEDGWQQFVEASRVLEGFWDDGILGYALIAASRP